MPDVGPSLNSMQKHRFSAVFLFVLGFFGIGKSGDQSAVAPAGLHLRGCRYYRMLHFSRFFFSRSSSLAVGYVITPVDTERMAANIIASLPGCPRDDTRNGARIAASHAMAKPIAMMTASPCAARGLCGSTRFRAPRRGKVRKFPKLHVDEIRRILMLITL